jgi:hypothetical protein
LAELAEEQDWRQAASADTADAYKQFLARHPEGKWAQEARIRAENFSLNEQPSPAGNPGSSVGPAQAAEPPALPDTPAASASTSTIAPGVPSMSSGIETNSHILPAYGAQLGAFSSEAAAKSQWTVLAARFDTELRGLNPRVVPFSVGSKEIYRLQVTLPDEARARALCESLRQHSQSCLPVAPH